MPNEVRNKALKPQLRLELRRFFRHELATIGVLTVDEEFECFVLEDPVRAAGVKVWGNTAIPAGRYQIVVTKSQRFGRLLPLLLSVPGFEGIRIHAGNTHADTEGCLLPGTGFHAHSGRPFVGESRVALAALQERISSAIAAGREVWINVVNLAEE